MPGFTNRIIVITIETKAAAKIFKILIPKKLHAEKSNAVPLKKSAAFRPSLGFSRIGSIFGSSCPSPKMKMYLS